eukprot:scaffold47242_cov35-Tisochrysis_lutea.AAC.3
MARGSTASAKPALPTACEEPKGALEARRDQSIFRQRLDSCAAARRALSFYSQLLLSASKSSYASPDLSTSEDRRPSGRARMPRLPQLRCASGRSKWRLELLSHAQPLPRETRHS